MFYILFIMHKDVYIYILWYIYIYYSTIYLYIYYGFIYTIIYKTYVLYTRKKKENALNNKIKRA